MKDNGSLGSLKKGSALLSRDFNGGFVGFGSQLVYGSQNGFIANDISDQAKLSRKIQKEHTDNDG